MPGPKDKPDTYSQRHLTMLYIQVMILIKYNFGLGAMNNLRKSISSGTLVLEDLFLLNKTLEPVVLKIKVSLSRREYDKVKYIQKVRGSQGMRTRQEDGRSS